MNDTVFMLAGLLYGLLWFAANLIWVQRPLGRFWALYQVDRRVRFRNSYLMPAFDRASLSAINSYPVEPFRKYLWSAYKRQANPELEAIRREAMGNFRWLALALLGLPIVSLSAGWLAARLFG